jgi:ammonium transporter Rh
MIGTIFLWMYWPSFNTALIGQPGSFQTAVVNTLLSLTGSCIATFLISYIFRGERKFCMVDIQNATLAGGVAIGSACDLPVTPGGALAVGMFAGFISVVGYTRIQSRLESAFGIYDTCGIFNLHGMPGLIGGLTAAISSAALSKESFLTSIDPSLSEKIASRSSSTQALFQLAFLASTVAIAILSGYLSGALLKNVAPNETFFDDSAVWEVIDILSIYDILL